MNKNSQVMKLFRTISTATFAAVAMAGCSADKAMQPMTVSMVSSIEERRGDEVTLTEYEWSAYSMPAGERQTLNGTPVYEDSGYEYDEDKYTITCFRSRYDGSGTEIARERRVTTLTEKWKRSIKLEVFLMGPDGNDSEPVERWEEIYENGILVRYEHEKDGQMINEKYDFVYDFTELTESFTEKDRTGIEPGTLAVEKRVTIWYAVTDMEYPVKREKKVGGKTVERTIYFYSGYYSNGYETYSVEDEQDKKLLEKESAHEVDNDNMTESYEVTVYGENPVSTRVKITYEPLVIKY